MMKPGTMSVEAFLQEAHILKQCEHPNLVKLFAVCTREEPFYIITEFMRNGCLLTYLRKLEELPTTAIVDMAAQIAGGMMYLEERKLVHRDLAARNVLVGEVLAGIPTVKVADFGMARWLSTEDSYSANTSTKVPIKWTAPEAARYGNFTVKSDVWSYGILLYEIVTKGAIPYPELNNRELFDELERGYRMANPANCPEIIYTEVMLKCWDPKPYRRPTFEYMYYFFSDYFHDGQETYSQTPNA